VQSITPRLLLVAGEKTNLLRQDGMLMRKGKKFRFEASLGPRQAGLHSSRLDYGAHRRAFNARVLKNDCNPHMGP
jgi:hypothetical protein